MKNLLLSLALLCAYSTLAQNTLWEENFSTDGCSQGTLANGLVTENGLWAVNSIGTNDTQANNFYVSAMANNTGEGNCSSACSTDLNASLHVSNLATLGVEEDAGATYLEVDGAFCGLLGLCAITNKRAESPMVNTTGFSDLTLSFLYIEGGNTLDNALLWINTGSEWTVLADMPKTINNCGGFDGTWTSFTIALPESTNNNEALQIGFSWSNNDDGVASDPSFAVDNIAISGALGNTCPYDFNGNGQIEIGDLIIFLSEFNCMGCPLTDVDEDGQTTVSELVDLLGLFGSFCQN